ncbi:unnamed protein product, partial [Laminaria digitata]
MSSCRLGRRPVDLLHEVADLHAYVERELHGVAVAVSDLDDFFFAAIEPAQSSNVNTRESGQAAAAAAAAAAASRALAGRRLHAILSRGRKRILSALARQRILLWEFSGAGNPTAEYTPSAAAEGENTQRDRKERTANSQANSRRLQVGPYQRQPSVGAATGDDDDDDDHDDWKRHTLLGMHRLLSRKASEKSATATSRATLVRDISKIAAALERLGIQTTAAAAAPAAPLADDVQQPPPTPSSTPAIIPSTPPADNLSGDGPATLASGVATKEAPIDNAMRMASDVVDVPTTTLRREGEGCDGGTTSSPSCSERGARESEEGVGGSNSNSHPLSSSRSRSSSSNSNALLLHRQLLLPDGIDELLRRISEGVRPPSRNPVPAPPAAPLTTPSERLRPSNISSAPAAEVAMPPSVLSKNTREEARQGSTCGLFTPGCSNIRVGLGVACGGDDEREARCLSQERTRSITGCGEGYDNGGRGVGGTGERRTASSPVDFSGACCLCEGSEVIGQRPG